MYKSKLIEVFSDLTVAEQLALGKFVRSPYHNKREDVIQLYDYLYEHRDLEDREVLRKENVFYQLFPQEEYKASKIDYIMSFLLKVLEDFLTIESLKNDPIEAEIRLAEAYRKRHLDKHFRQSWRQAQHLQESQPMRDGNYFRRAYRLEFEQYAYSALKKRAEDKNLQELANSFDAYYMGERLKQSCLMLAHQAVYSREYTMGPTHDILRFLKEHQEHLSLYPVIGLYYYYYYTLTTEKLEDAEDHFQAFKTMFLQQIDKLPAEEQINLYVFAINYCIRRSNTGSPEYVSELLSFYKVGLKEEILLDNGQIHHSTFKNVVKAALKSKEFNWADQFIRNYSKMMSSDFRDAYVHYAFGELYFRKNDYREAMLHLQQIQHGDIFMNLDARVILLKMYYELDEYEAMEAALNSMKAYLSRKDQLGYHRENYKNILRLSRKLLTVNPFSKKEKAELKQEIESTKVLTERQWLLDQLSAL